MSLSEGEIIEAALSLSAESKARLADRLLASLEPAQQHDIDTAWTLEAQRRLEAFERGEIGTMPADDVLRPR